MKKLSLLQNYTQEKFKRNPYPYLVIHNALPESIYKELSDTYPSDEFIVANDVRKKTSLINARPNSRYQISAQSVLGGSTKLSPLWEDFIEFHTSDTFLHQFLEIFEKDIVNIYPNFEEKMNRPISQFRSGVRNLRDSAEVCEIAMDCQLGINTPVVKYGRVTGPHCDSPLELFAGLFYLRTSYDDSSGGDLMVYSWKSRQKFYGKSKVKDDFVIECDRIPYAANCFALLLNTSNSLHGVSSRTQTEISRRLINVIGEVYPKMPDGLFQPYKTNTQSVADWIKNKLFRNFIK